jgi:hypothetical protein
VQALGNAAQVHRVVLSGAGHAMMAEVPGAVLDALWNFAGAQPSS